MLYALIAMAPRTVVVDAPKLVLTPGRNILTVTTDDIEGLISVLKSEGVTIVSVHDFVQPETTLSDLVLEGEDPRIVLGPAYGR